VIVEDIRENNLITASVAYIRRGEKKRPEEKRGRFKGRRALPTKPKWETVSIPRRQVTEGGGAV